ncbi:GNAT family N-acetyltransferase [Streptomyces sp. NPDC048111]|uniref:GNAT family N-acetyltransferase n=1 Tax=Streptomyces sp. NPDC048111 TaxID=3365500 RepID=UPI0037136960
MSDAASQLPPPIRLVVWSDNGLDLLRSANTPLMTDHLGGPESEERLLARNARYAAMSARPAAEGRMFKIVLDGRGEEAGTVGFWPHTGADGPVYETGYGILPEFRGRGLAVAALRAVVAEARAAGGARTLHAYPSVDHTASNAVCRRAGFTLAGELDFEYPPGTWLRSNDWWTDLCPVGGPGDEDGGRPGAG